MKTIFTVFSLILFLAINVKSFAQAPGVKYSNADYKLKGATVWYETRFDALVFEVQVEG